MFFLTRVHRWFLSKYSHFIPKGTKTPSHLPGDSFSVLIGCDRLYKTCKSETGNKHSTITLDALVALILPCFWSLLLGAFQWLQAGDPARNALGSASAFGLSGLIEHVLLGFLCTAAWGRANIVRLQHYSSEWSGMFVRRRLSAFSIRAAYQAWILGRKHK